MLSGIPAQSLGWLARVLICEHETQKRLRGNSSRASTNGYFTSPLAKANSCGYNTNSAREKPGMASTVLVEYNIQKSC